LIQNWADIEISNDTKKTPLLRAIQNNHEEAVKVLLEHSADPTAQDPKWTPLHSCAFNNRSKMLDALLESFPRPSIDFEVKSWGPPLYEAAMKGHYGIARTLIKAGAWLDYPCSTFSIPISWFTGFLQLHGGPGDPSASSACFQPILGFHSFDTLI
jgi:ankyrin repeat protein